MGDRQQLNQACNLALHGEWDASHKIAQDYNDVTACWIHAVLHKIEGNGWKSRYWYARTAGNSMKIMRMQVMNLAQ